MINKDRLIDFIDSSSYYDLYPSYFQEPIKDADYMFKSKKGMDGELQDVIDLFESLPDPIPVYRVMRVESEDKIYKEDLGSSWSFDKQSALDFGNMHNLASVLLSGKIEKKFVDREATLRTYMHNSFRNDFEAENEIYIPITDNLTNLKINYL